MGYLADIPEGWLFGGIAAAAAVVVWAGVRLTRYGDALGERFNLSRTWVGVILLAMITSLPELVVTLSSQLAVSRPRIAIGNVCGSNLINLCIFAVMDMYEGRGALSRRLSRGLIRPAMMGLLIMGLAGAGLMLAAPALSGLANILSWPISGAILALCLYSIWKTDRGGQLPAEALPQATARRGGRGLGVRFGVCTALVVASGVALIVLCDSLLEQDLQFGSATIRLKESVVGSVGVAFVTSLPELVVCLTAVRLGAFDMAMGNIFGSNVFNMLLLPLAHFVRPKEAFWPEALGSHGMVLGGAMLLTVIIAVGIRRKSPRAVLRLGWDGLIVAVLGICILVAVAALGVSV